MRPVALSPTPGYLYVVSAAVLWATSGSLSKFLFNTGLSPIQLLQLRTSLAAAVLFLWLLLWRPTLLIIPLRSLFYFAFLGTGLAAVQLTYLFTISQIQVAAAILLQYQAPVFIFLYSVLISREKLNTKTAIAVMTATTGCYLVVGGYNLDILHMNRAGIIGGLCAALTFAWYSVSSERGMKRADPWTVVFYALLFAAVVANIIHPPFRSFKADYGISGWASILFISIMGTLLPFGFYNQGIKRIRAMHASITGTLEPMTAALISYIFLNETLEVPQIMGAGFIIGAVILLQLRLRP